MLSPADHHLRVPRRLEGEDGNRAYRRKLLRAAAADPALQKIVLDRCREDILYWINSFVTQIDPRKPAGQSGRVGPFLTWPAQERALVGGHCPLLGRRVYGILECVEDQKDLAIEKGRDEGASWLSLLAQDWLFLFHPHNQFLMISRSEALVDSDSPNSLFWKLDFVHRHLPAWMMPRVERTKRHFVNLDNGSTVVGEATTKRAGVGGRATAMFIDEFAQIEQDYEVLHRTADTTGCRIFNSTHTGSATAFAEVCARVDVRKVVLHWSMNPHKAKGLYKHDPESREPGGIVKLDAEYVHPPDYQFVTDGTPTGGPFPGLRSPWYDGEVARRVSKRAVAIDLDINVEGSTHQVFDPLTIHRLKRRYCRDPLWRGRLAHGPDGHPGELVASDAGRLMLWTVPSPRHTVPAGRYAVGVDVAAGTGATPSCLSVVSAAGDKVAEFADPTVEPEEFGRLAVAVCRLFADRNGQGAYLVWEMAGAVGKRFGQGVAGTSFNNLYHHTDDFFDPPRRSEKPGWYPTKKEVKNALVLDYQAALYNERFRNPSEAALDETLQFRYTPRGDIGHGGEESPEDPTGARQNHGDRVIADALANKGLDEIGVDRPDEVRPEEAPAGSILGRRLRRGKHGTESGGWD